jgi:hypothetical protein
MNELRQLAISACIAMNYQTGFLPTELELWEIVSWVDGSKRCPSNISLHRFAAAMKQVIINPRG